MDQFNNPQFTTNGIAYYKFGEGSSTLLLVHGSFGNGMMWQKQIPLFTQSGYKVVTLDLQGHGQSKNFDLTKTTMDSYSNDIKSVLETIGGNSILIGHSMSGLTVLMIALESDNINKVISIDPSPSKEIQGEGSTNNIPDIYTAMEAGMPNTPEGMKKSMPDIDPSMFSTLIKMLGSESGTARKQRKAGISIAKENLDPKQILFLGAELGDSLPFGISAESTKKMAEYYKKPYAEIPEASHPGMLMGKYSDSVAEKIVEFLK